MTKTFIQEQYCFPGSPRTFYRKGSQHWVEQKDKDNATTRTYCDATSWHQSLEIDRENYAIPPYEGAEVRMEYPYHDDAVDAMALAYQPPSAPWKCRVLAAVATVTCLMLSLVLLAMMITGQRGEIVQLLKDIGTLWTGKEPDLIPLD